MTVVLDERPLPGRDLSDAERLLHLIHSVGGLIATATMHVEGPLTEGLMRGALDRLQRRHAILQAHIAWRGYALSRHFPNIHRRLVFETRGTRPIELRMLQGDWRQQLQKELRTPIFRPRSPRMRVSVVSESAGRHHVILVCDHTIGDAQAAFAAMRDILGHLADPSAPVAPGDSALPPALESAHRKSSDPAHPYEPGIRLPLARARVKAETLFEKRVLDRDVTERLRAALRERRVTLNGAVAAAVLKAAAERYGMNRLTCLTNAEFRRLMQPPVPNETFGCFIDIVRTTHDTGQPFWELARDVGRRLILAVTRHQHQSSILRLWDWNGYRHEAIPTMLSNYCLDGIAVTTGGETGLGTNYGPFTLADVTICTSLNPVGIGLYVGALEFRGTLQLTFCYGSRRLHDSDVAAIADRVQHLLTNLPAD